MNIEPLLSLDDVSEILQMSKGWIQGEIKAGRLKQTKLGKIVRVEPADLRAYIDQCKKQPVPETVTTLCIPEGFDTEAAILKVTETRQS